MFEAVAGKANNRWWLWTFVGPDTVVFLFDPTRSTKVVADHLGIDVEASSLAEERHLLMSSDFYTSTSPSQASTVSTRCGAGRTSAATSFELLTPTKT